VVFRGAGASGAKILDITIKYEVLYTVSVHTIGSIQ